MIDIICKVPLIGDLIALLFFPVIVEVYEKRGDAIIKKKDRGREITKRGKENFWILFERKRIEPPEFKNYLITTRGKPILMLFKATSGEYRPFEPEMGEDDRRVYSEVKLKTKKTIGKNKEKMTVKEEGLDLTVIDKNVLFWHIQEHRRNRERFYKPKWYELYAPYIVLAVAGVLMMIMIVTVSKELTVMSSQLNGVANAINQAAVTFKEGLSGVNPRPP